MTGELFEIVMSLTRPILGSLPRSILIQINGQTPVVVVLQAWSLIVGLGGWRTARRQLREWITPLPLVAVLLMGAVASPGRAGETPHVTRPWWKHLLRPFRSSELPTRTNDGCQIGVVTCFAGGSTPGSNPSTEFKRPETLGSPEDIVLLRTKTDRRGPFGHHWIEVETSAGLVGIGFGPSTMPFIDAGQIGLHDQYGNIERYSGAHPIQLLTLPPIDYQYARGPEDGFEISEPLPITREYADRLIEGFRELRRVEPYVPLINDCRTFVCRVKAKVQGKSTLPCHLLLKGYW